MITAKKALPNAPGSFLKGEDDRFFSFWGIPGGGFGGDKISLSWALSVNFIIEFIEAIKGDALVDLSAPEAKRSGNGPGYGLNHGDAVCEANEGKLQ